MVETKKQGGLAGIIAGDSAICLCGAEDESLLYRGYSIEDLVKGSFEETAFLLLRGHLPNQEELIKYQTHLKHLRNLSPTLKTLMENIPPTYDLMAAMRSQISLLGHLEPEDLENEKTHIPDRLLACSSSLLLYWYYFHTSQTKIEIDTQTNSIAGHILTLIRQDTPTEEEIRALDISLTLYAEHEFNASTFTVRTIGSTLADIYSAVCGGIGALSGPLHGGANEKAYHLISNFKTPDEAEKGILEMLKNKELIMGFGHRVYTSSDPRSAIIKEIAKKLSETAEDKHLFAIAERIDSVMKREKNLFTNLDFYSALAYHYLKIPTHFFTPLFVMARLSGWCSHLLEQREHNKIIRPASNYIGPAHQKWVKIDARET